MVREVLQVVGLALFSSVKFLFAPSTVYLSGYSYLETILITICGGVLGVFVFFKSGTFIFSKLDRWIGRRKKKKSFTKRNRTIVKLKNKYGLYGLALLSPCVISIPLGCILAAKYFAHDRRTIPFFITAVVFWSFVLTTFTAFIRPFFIGE